MKFNYTRDFSADQVSWKCIIRDRNTQEISLFVFVCVEAQIANRSVSLPSARFLLASLSNSFLFTFFPLSPLHSSLINVFIQLQADSEQTSCSFASNCSVNRVIQKDLFFFVFQSYFWSLQLVFFSLKVIYFFNCSSWYLKTIFICWETNLIKKFNIVEICCRLTNVAINELIRNFNYPVT